MTHPSSAVVVLTTLAESADGVGFARTLVDERLAACVNILPSMRSVYRWKGAVEVGSELQLVIKTTVERLPALEARIRAIHPYELPEFLVLDAAGSAAYLAWIGTEVATPSA